MIDLLLALTLVTAKLDNHPACARSKIDNMPLLDNYCDPSKQPDDVLSSTTGLTTSLESDSKDFSVTTTYAIHIPRIPDWDTDKGLEIIKGLCTQSILLVGDGIYVIIDDHKSIAVCQFGEFVPNQSSNGN